jgi:hypothetical protein
MMARAKTGAPRARRPGPAIATPDRVDSAPVRAGGPRTRRSVRGARHRGGAAKGTSLVAPTNGNHRPEARGPRSRRHRAGGARRAEDRARAVRARVTRAGKVGPRVTRTPVAWVAGNEPPEARARAIPPRAAWIHVTQRGADPRPRATRAGIEGTRHGRAPARRAAPPRGTANGKRGTPDSVAGLDCATGANPRRPGGLRGGVTALTGPAPR